MVFALMVELIAIHSQITIIKIWEPGLERLFARPKVYFWGYLGWHPSLEAGLHELLK